MPHSLLSHYQREIHPLFLDDILVITSYDSIKNTLESYKYQSDRGQKNEILQYFISAQESISQYTDNYCIITVPMHWSRYAIRGFDHMEYIAKDIAKLYGFPYKKLLHGWFSRRQSRLKKKDRLKNRSHIYTIRAWQQVPEYIIIVDDVISTGSTLNSCAEVLKKAGAKQVVALVLASNQ